MADNRANIDLVFRNGLMDYEVLPPAEVWDNIQASVNVPKKRIVFPYIKVAAAITVVATMSFLAYRLGVEVSTSQLNVMSAANQESFSSELNPVQSPVATNIVKNEVKTIPVNNNIVTAVNPEEKSVNLTGVHSEKTNPVISKKLIAESRMMPGIQDPADIKYAKVKPIEFQSFTYQGLQDNIEVPEKQRWSVSAIASPTYYSQFTSGGNEIAKQVLESDQTRSSYTGGVGLAYKVSSRFSIQTGLYYSSLGQEVGGVNAYSGFQQYDNSKSDHNFELITALGTVFSRNSDVFLNSSDLPARVQTYYTNDVFDPVKANLSYVSSTIYQDLSFLELPVILRYKVVDSKIDLNVVGGMSYNFLINNSVYAVLDGGKYPVGTTENMNSVSLSSSLGMGMEYNLTDNLSLNLEPTFRYYLNPFSGKTGFHPYSIGVFSGVSYKF
jgi:opacity protein-like surface antigen